PENLWRWVNSSDRYLFTNDYKALPSGAGGEVLCSLLFSGLDSRMGRDRVFAYASAINGHNMGPALEARARQKILDSKSSDELIFWLQCFRRMSDKEGYAIDITTSSHIYQIVRNSDLSIFDQVFELYYIVPIDDDHYARASELLSMSHVSYLGYAYPKN